MIPKMSNPELEFVEPLLKDSIQQFLMQYRNGRTHFPDFDSIFTRILQDYTDPPLELVWFYSAVRFYSSRLAFQDDCVKLSVSFFQLLVSCSDSYTGAKKIAVLSPIVYQLSRLVITRKELKRDVLSLLEGIVSYISICCHDESPEDDVLMASGSFFADLTLMWVLDEVAENSTLEDCLEIFMPFVSKDLRRGMGSESCRVGYLAGIVTFQVLLLSVCLKFGSEAGEYNLENDLKDHAIQMISGFQSYYFLDIILKTLLLEPGLPVTSLLSDVALWDILTGVVITSTENLFLQSENRIAQQSTALKTIAINWLFLVDKAMESARRKNDQEKTRYYMNMFSSSHVPSYLIDLVISEGGLMEDADASRNSTPTALIKWLVSMEEQGVRVFDSDHSKNYAKTVLQEPRSDLNPIQIFSSADRDTDMDDQTISRKRKEERKKEGQSPLKLLKHRHNSLQESPKFQPFFFSERLANGTEVDAADMEL